MLRNLAISFCFLFIANVTKYSCKIKNILFSPFYVSSKALWSSLLSAYLQFYINQLSIYQRNHLKEMREWDSINGFDFSVLREKLREGYGGVLLYKSQVVFRIQQLHICFVCLSPGFRNTNTFFPQFDFIPGQDSLIFPPTKSWMNFETS